jgi:hypothetical protein
MDSLPGREVIVRYVTGGATLFRPVARIEYGLSDGSIVAELVDAEDRIVALVPLDMVHCIAFSDVLGGPGDSGRPTVGDGGDGRAVPDLPPDDPADYCEGCQR